MGKGRGQRADGRGQEGQEGRGQTAGGTRRQEAEGRRQEGIVGYQVVLAVRSV
jgi:hypothetical protein